MLGEASYRIGARRKQELIASHPGTQRRQAHKADKSARASCLVFFFSFFEDERESWPLNRKRVFRKDGFLNFNFEEGYIQLAIYSNCTQLCVMYAHTLSPLTCRMQGEFEHERFLRFRNVVTSWSITNNNSILIKPNGVTWNSCSRKFFKEQHNLFFGKFKIRKHKKFHADSVSYISST